jgi:RAB protein geranylgeranyltransferase component A
MAVNLVGGTTSASAALILNAQTGTTYTLVAADAENKLVTSDNASAVTITVPPSVFTVGQQINVASIGAGLTSFAEGSGVTITSTGATAEAPVLRAQYSAGTVICTAADTFLIVGDLS